MIQADGGTRTASITGAFEALALALETLRSRDVLRTIPLNDSVAAISVGIVDGEALLDLAYEDDSRAEVDMNIVKTGDGRFIEVQGTAEGMPFNREAPDRCSAWPTRDSSAGAEAARDRRTPGQISRLNTMRLVRRRSDARRSDAGTRIGRKVVRARIHARATAVATRREAGAFLSRRTAGRRQQSR